MRIALGLSSLALVLAGSACGGTTNADDAPRAVTLAVPGDVEDSLGGCPPVSPRQVARMDTVAVVVLEEGLDAETESIATYTVEEWLLGGDDAELLRIAGSNVSISYFPSAKPDRRYLVAGRAGDAEPCLFRPWTERLDALYRQALDL